MILYRKAPQLRIRRVTAPEAPFWAATTIAPYSARRASPVAIDYLALRAAAAERLEVTVCEDIRNELDRVRVGDAPILIDAAEAAERVFRRGDEILGWCAQERLPALHLISTLGSFPANQHEESTIVIAAWPPEPVRLSELFASAAASGRRWGVAIPVIFPVTTELAQLGTIAQAAAANGASFLAAFSPEVDPTAKQAIAQTIGMRSDDDRYALLFHASAEPLQLSTERHIASLAHEQGLDDFILPPAWHERSNWNAAVLLTLTASRMIAMELDVDLAGAIARSARIVAALDKPLARIAETANLAIIAGIDDTSIEMLTEWLERGSASFGDFVSEQWRLRRG